MKINKLSKNLQNWLSQFEFDLNADVNDSQTAPDYLNRANHGTPIWAYTPLQLAMAYGKQEFIAELIPHNTKETANLFFAALDDANPGARVAMITCLLKYIPVTQAVIDRVNQQVEETMINRMTHCLFNFFCDDGMDSVNRQANQDILNMLNDAYHKQRMKKSS